MSIHDELFKRQTFKAEGKPHGWVQWKGTNACMDVHCECGCLSHIDSDFLYAVQCPKCGRAYYVNGTVELVPMTKDEHRRWDIEGNCEARVAQE